MISTARTATVPIIKRFFRLMPLCTRPSRFLERSAPFHIRKPGQFPGSELTLRLFFRSFPLLSLPQPLLPAGIQKAVDDLPFLFPPLLFLVLFFRIRSCSSSESCSSRSGSTGSCSGLRCFFSRSAFFCLRISCFRPVSGSSSSSRLVLRIYFFLLFAALQNAAESSGYLLYTSCTALKKRTERRTRLLVFFRIFSNSSSSNPSSS